MEKQLLALKPSPVNFRKIIVSTNVAETSITIHGVAFVVDCCFTKLNYYDPATDMENLITIPASQASCQQRAGRAGRLKAGKCYRLCTEQDFKERLPLAVRPEIERANLTQLVLLMKALGITNIVKFKFLTPPNHKNLARAVENLYALKMLDDDCELTPELGYQLADAPFDPRILIMLLQSVKDKENILIEDVLDLAAMLCVPNLFVQTNDLSVQSRAKKKAGVIEGDHITLLNMLNLYRGKKGFHSRRSFCKEVMLNPKAMEKALEMRNKLAQFCQKKLKIKLQRSTDDDDAQGILKCVLSGYFTNVAQKQHDGSYRNIRQMETPLYIHPASVLVLIQPHWVVYHQILCTHKNYMKEVSAIQPEWLLEVAPHFYVDHKKAQLTAAHVKEAKKLEELEEDQKQVKQAEEEAAAIQIVGIKRKGLGQGTGFKRKKVGDKRQFTINSFPKFPGLKGQSGSAKADFDDEL